MQQDFVLRLRFRRADGRIMAVTFSSTSFVQPRRRPNPWIADAFSYARQMLAAGISSTRNISFRLSREQRDVVSRKGCLWVPAQLEGDVLDGTDSSRNISFQLSRQQRDVVSRKGCFFRGVLEWSWGVRRLTRHELGLLPDTCLAGLIPARCPRRGFHPARKGTVTASESWLLRGQIARGDEGSSLGGPKMSSRSMKKNL